MILISDFFRAKHVDGEEHARTVAISAIRSVQANPGASFACIFPESLLNIVPPGWTVEALGAPYEDSDEPAFMVTNQRSVGRPR